jgi:ATP phosphoribosyltransferase
MSDPLILAVPSKGRLMEQTAETFARAGLVLKKVGSERGYKGVIEGLDGVEVIFVSASEIVEQLKAGRAHLGVSGEDLAREHVADMEKRFQIMRKLGFGHADVVVAVPQAWIDVRVMSDLEAVGRDFRRAPPRYFPGCKLSASAEGHRRSDRDLSRHLRTGACGRRAHQGSLPAQ